MLRGERGEGGMCGRRGAKGGGVGGEYTRGLFVKNLVLGGEFKGRGAGRGGRAFCGRSTGELVGLMVERV